MTALMLIAVLPDRLRTSMREGLFDRMLQQSSPLRTAAAVPRIVVIDIDRESLGALGPWPWPRGHMARLLGAAAAAGAAAIAIDVVFVGPDQRSPGSVARRLAAETGSAELAGIAGALPDGDRALTTALHDRPGVLAFLLDPNGPPLEFAAPVLVRNAAAVDGVWTAQGGQSPLRELAEAAAGLGAVSLPADADGVIRRVPVLVGVGGRIAPGLAAEVVRIAAEASGYLVTGPACASPSVMAWSRSPPTEC